MRLADGVVRVDCVRQEDRVIARSAEGRTQEGRWWREDRRLGEAERKAGRKDSVGIGSRKEGEGGDGISGRNSLYVMGTALLVSGQERNP